MSARLLRPGGRRAAALVALVWLFAACAWQPRGATAYAGKAMDAAEQVLSAARTAEVIVRSALTDRILTATAEITLREAEDEAGGAVETFAGFQPPDDASAQLRDAALRLLDEASDAIQEARVALLARRIDAGLAGALQRAAADVESFMERAR